jgi:hypothetical protein
MRHPNKHIAQAVRYAESLGWRVRLSNGHAWGIIYCPESSREGHKMSIYSTPRDPEGHARDILRFVDACPHGQGA